jgi:hypothetical protein
MSSVIAFLRVYPLFSIYPVYMALGSLNGISQGQESVLGLKVSKRTVRLVANNTEEISPSYSRTRVHRRLTKSRTIV